MFCISSPVVDAVVPTGITLGWLDVSWRWESLEGSSWQSWLVTQLVTCLVKEVGASSDTRNGECYPSHERQNDKHQCCQSSHVIND